MLPKLENLKHEHAYRTKMAKQNQNEANRLENCIYCVKTKTVKDCPSKCPYLVK